MSRAASFPDYEALPYLNSGEEPAVGASAPYVARPKWLPLPFMVPVLLCGISWASGGVPAFTDAGFVILTALCIGFLLVEMVRFPRRFGTGGILLFGGVLIWFCDDYLKHWFHHDFRAESWMPPDVVAKSAFYHCLLVISMSVGLLIQRGKWFERGFFFSITEPRSPQIYFALVVAVSMLGILPYFAFSRESVLSVATKLLKLQASSIDWAYGRSGNLNYNWGGYIAELLNVGAVGGILGVFYALLISKSLLEKIVCWILWLHFFMYGYYSGRRGVIVYFVLPPLILLFMKYQDAAVQRFQKFSIRAYLICGLILVAMLFVVQIQTKFRGSGMSDVKFEEVNFNDIEGNNMFSEGLSGYQLIPDQQPFFSNRWPGEGLIRPIPEFVFWILVHPIPRALWHDKPVDPVWAWYNQVVTGSDNMQGTTISKGLVGWWYFRFGIFGVIEGGIVMGWLMVVSERALQNAQGRPIVIMLSLAFSTWLFRCYRDVGMLELYTLLVGVIFLWVVMRPFRDRSDFDASLPLG
jgi:hypothetical protein